VRGNIAQIRFSWDKDISFAAMLSLAGAVPLPPYIKREPVQIDRERYQTIYSSQEGSVAAPTAGLHFTDYVFSTLKEKGLACHEITLHVGAGTFQPVKTEKIADHAMHAEYFEVHQSLIKLILSLGHRVSCVGTTSVRTLESLYWTGVKLCNFPEADSLPDLDQWEAYFLPQNYSIEKSFTALDEWFIRNKIQRAFASTKLMIIPGYQFRMTDTLITNFHQPGSTLLLLIGAFIGKSWKEVYDYALNHEFRFLSYGDSSLLFNSPSQIS
jgi:S-adenosylmethionine:tRNA ribosyltransferase-isomerase